MSNATNIEKRVNTSAGPEQTRGGRTYIPAVDIIEHENELLLVADVPGASADGIDIEYERGQMTIRACAEQRQNEQTEYALREYGVGDFVRTFQIGEGINAAKIDAQLKDGVLTLHLPKAEAAKTRKIAVKTT